MQKCATPLYSSECLVYEGFSSTISGKKKVLTLQPDGYSESALFFIILRQVLTRRFVSLDILI
jgi:hypothetical protein